VLIRCARLSVLPLTILFVFAACGSLPSKQKTTAENALKALQKLEAATEIGVNYQVYQPMLIEAKTQVNEVNNNLPDGELKSELSAAMDAYADAGDAWDAFIRNGKGDEEERFLQLNNPEPGMPITESQTTARRLREKYKLQTTADIASSLTGILPDYEGTHVALIKSKTIPVIWNVAKGHVNSASKLLNE
jgi:hypothetical protein